MRSLLFAAILAMPQESNPYLEALHREAMALGGYATPVSQATPSMLGSGYAGNLIVVVPAPEYAPNDDVVYKRAGGGTGLHRVKATKPGYVFTKGTFNSSGDGWIPIGDILGKVTKLVDAKTGQPKPIRK